MGDLTYSAGGNCSSYHDPYGRYSFPSGQQLYGGDWDLVATDLAEDYAVNHDGWEASWPLQIRIYEDGNEVARFEVEREYEPVYRAYEVEGTNP